jgi:DNA-binding beta-propeller fold protein YncE
MHPVRRRQVRPRLRLVRPPADVVAAVVVAAKPRPQRRRVTRTRRRLNADRNNNRIQIFSLEGKFQREVFIARDTSTSNGTVYSLAFSVDPAQRFLYVADAGNGRVRILNRQTMEVVGSIGRWGRQPGQFMVPHDIAVDSKGNLYVGEIREGNIQKFNLRSALGR